MKSPALACLLTVTGLTLALSGCDTVDPDRPPFYGGSDSEETGSLGLSLTLSSGATVEVVKAEISSALLSSPIVRNIPVAPAASTVSAEFGGLIAGDYSISLSAESTDGKTTCAGSADFTIIVDDTVGVIVPLTCKAEGTTGEVIIDVGLNVCPELQFLFVAPLKVAVGSNISVEATVVDPDDDPVSYEWTANAGSFADPNAAATTYTCTQPGLRTITLTTNDGGDCEQQTHLQVACILTTFTSCQAGSYQTVAPTEFNDRECSPCPAETYSTTTNVAACVPWTTCDAGEFTEVPGSPTNDQTCDDCPAGTFSAEENAPVCTAWSPCAWGQLQVASGTATTDTQCGPGGEPFRQFGTSGSDGVNGLATDAAGNVYAAGVTNGALAGAGLGSFDAFVRKYAWTGELVWTQQFGTSALDYASAVAVGSDGSVYVAGYTSDGLDQPTLGLSDAFLRKYDANGAFVWSRQFGTTNNDYGYGVAVDGSGGVFIAGMTQGNLDGANLGGPDGFLRKYDASGNALWTRQYGTSAFEYPSGVAVDGAGNAYVAGATSGNLSGTNAGSQDGYVRKYSSTGAVLWTSQFGTTLMEMVRGPAADASGRVYAVGSTTGAFVGTNLGTQDAFLRAYDASGAHQFTKQFGTTGSDVAYGVTVAAGDVYLAGVTTGALDGTSTGGSDAFVRHYSNSGNLIWSDQYGTSSADTAIAAAPDASTNVFIGGSTDGALVGTSAGGTDAYVFKLPEP